MGIRPLRFLLAALLALAGNEARAAQAVGDDVAPLAIVGARLVDPTGKDRPPVVTVLVQGHRIATVGWRVRIPTDARIIHAEGRFLVPGLWDMHAHVAALGPPGGAPERYVGYGVLGIRDMGGHADVLFALREAIRRGERFGPAIYMAGPTLNGEQAADFHRVVRTDAQARAAVRELKASGVDFIKIHRQTTREAFFAIADETKKVGLDFVGHVPLMLDWITAADAGMRTIEHIQTMVENELLPGPDPVKATFATVERLKGPRGDAIFAAMERNHVYFDPTLVGYELTWEDDPPAKRALKQKFYAEMSPMVMRAARAGVPILAGTDVLKRHGDLLLVELERLVAVGLTPRQALAAATTTPFSLTRTGPGRIAVGDEASFLIVDADPLTDVRNLRRLSTVVLRGRVIGDDELAKLRATAD